MLKLLSPLNDNARAMLTLLLVSLIYGSARFGLKDWGLPTQYTCHINDCSPAALVAAPLIILSIFLTIFCFLSFLSGWWFLWLDYRTDRQPSRWSDIQSGMVGWCRINRGFRVSASPEGLYLTGILFVRFAFPTVCIPWEQLEQTERYTFLRAHRVVYRANTSHGPVSLHLAQELEEMINTHRQLPDRNT